MTRIMTIIKREEPATWARPPAPDGGDPNTPPPSMPTLLPPHLCTHSIELQIYPRLSSFGKKIRPLCISLTENGHFRQDRPQLLILSFKINPIIDFPIRNHLPCAILQPFFSFPIVKSTKCRLPWVYFEKSFEKPFEK